MKQPSYNAAAQKEFLAAIAAHFDSEIVSNKQINEFIEARGLPFPHFLINDPKAKVAWGKYRVGRLDKEVSAETPVVAAPVAAMTATVTPIARAKVSPRIAASVSDSFHQKKDETYVPFGFYNDLKSIIASKIFYPIYITGLSGNGKTLMVEQVCAALDRELIRVNITKETDETDLIGSYELVDGNTVRREGPVIVAMKRGAVLLLDETDYGSERLLCLQPILEGKPYFDKKTGELIYPANGFNICATANTKGKGSDDGRFIGANVLNEAFLERFAITVEQEYPDAKVEKKILVKNFEKNKITDLTFADRLVTWAEIVRKSYLENAVEEIISTRRLVHITKAYAIFGNRLKAIELCLNRFDTETKTVFLDLYTKVDADATPAVANTTDYVEMETAVIDDVVSNNSSTFVTKAVTAQAATPNVTVTSNTTIGKISQGDNKFVTPVDHNKNSTNVLGGLVWATAKHLTDATLKYGSVVQIKQSTNGGNTVYLISSHGHTMEAKESRLAGYSPDGILDLMVRHNKLASEGINEPNPFV